MGSVVFEQDSNIVDAQLQELKETQRIMREETETVPASPFSGYTFSDVIGGSTPMREAVSLAQKVAQQDCNILLVGETGTGKEIFAQSIHRASARRNRKFLAINCAAVPETLIEGLFFGTVKGSFTGSVNKAGYLEEADGGTLFLDELNSMSLAMQSKILRVLQEGTFHRVGGEEELHTDVRVVSSCNEDPFRLTHENLLRKDLFYRLSTVIIDLPPLRDRIEDLDELIWFYLGKQAHRFIRPVHSLAPGTLAILRSYHWPGNVRELFHVLDHILNVTDGGTAEPQHLPRYLQTAGTSEISPDPAFAEMDSDWLHSDLQTTMDRYECQVIRAVLEHYGSNISQAAQALGLRRQSLQYRIKKYGIII